MIILKYNSNRNLKDYYNNNNNINNNNNNNNNNNFNNNKMNLKLYKLYYNKKINGLAYNRIVKINSFNNQNNNYIYIGYPMIIY